MAAGPPSRPTPATRTPPRRRRHERLVDAGSSHSGVFVTPLCSASGPPETVTMHELRWVSRKSHDGRSPRRSKIPTLRPPTPASGHPSPINGPTSSPIPKPAMRTMRAPEQGLAMTPTRSAEAPRSRAASSVPSSFWQAIGRQRHPPLLGLRTHLGHGLGTGAVGEAAGRRATMAAEASRSRPVEDSRPRPAAASRSRAVIRSRSSSTLRSTSRSTTASTFTGAGLRT